MKKENLVPENKTDEKSVANIEPLLAFGDIHKGISVNQYGLDGVYIRTFKSIAEAQKALGVKGLGIYRAVQGKAKTCHGFQWRRATD
jgi:hypothetical protein